MNTTPLSLPPHTSAPLDSSPPHRRNARQRSRVRQVRQVRRRQLRHVLEQVNCLLWQADVREVFAQLDWVGVLYDTERHTRLDWDLRVVNKAEVPSWLPVNQAQGESVTDAWVRSRDLEDEWAAAIVAREALWAGQPRYTQTFRNKMADGTVRWMFEDVRIQEETSGAIGDAPRVWDGSPPLRHWRLTGVVTDITEQKLAEERQRALAEDLRRSNAVLQEFAYIASHDLKEPLRKIETFSDLLRRSAREELGADARDYLDRMTCASGRMRAMIQALLDYSRVIGRPCEMVPVDLSEITTEVVTDLEARIAEAGGRVEVGPLPTITADPLQMRQLVQNLIANALKFHRPDAPPFVTVTAESRREDESVAVDLAFTDNGIGFDPQHAERIFHIFERLAGRSSGGEGCGVGLSICRKIAERHGGTVRAEGRPGEGATFTVTLPLMPSAA